MSISSLLEILRQNFEVIEELAMGLDQDEPKDELVNSLKQIKVTYEKSKERLEKDLNKMEY